MKKIKIKAQKGITLIALIITIIVLLILAMVSIKIGMDKGLIGKTNEAKTVQTQEEEKEKLTLAYSEYQIGKNNNSKYTMQNALNNINANATANGDDVLGYSVVFTKTNNEYTITASGEIIEGIANRWDGKSKEKPLITEDKNWHISNAAQLKYFADCVNGTLTEEEKDGIELTETTTVYLEKNIDLGARANENGEKLIGEEWTPIGKTKELTFLGTFDGQNHYISGVYVNVDGNFAGIFGNSNTIKNLIVKDSYIEAQNCVGGIVGVVRKGDIENCVNQNTTVIAKLDGAAGVVGQAEGKIINCKNTGKIKGDKRGSGIVVIAKQNIENCENRGEVNAGRAAGIAGWIIEGEISNCKNYGDITSNRIKDASGAYSAGIVASGNEQTSVNNCSNFGKISINFQKKYNETEKGWSIAAGISLVGANDIVNCNNSGEISVISPNWWNVAGGIVGQAGSKSKKVEKIQGCSNSGKISANGLNSSYFVLPGGIIGDGYAGYEVTECYNCGDVEGRKGSYIYEGGILGRIQTSKEGIKVERCFSNGSVMGYEAKGRVQAGGITGDLTSTNVNQVKQAYYYDKNNNIKGALKYDDYPDNEVKKIENNFNSLEEFLNWLK